MGTPTVEDDRPTCSTCPFWDREATTWDYPGGGPTFGPAAFVRLPVEVQGVCKRSNITRPHRPASDWCGEHPDFVEYLRQRPHAAR